MLPYEFGMSFYCRIKIATLARDTERSHVSLCRARINLITAQILIGHETRKGYVRINQYYTTWLKVDRDGKPTGPRFSPRELEYIEADTLPFVSF
jgi:hypothetical protein